MKKNHITLELNKIIDMLKSYIRLEDNLSNLDEFTLSNDLNEINKMLDETDEATKIIQRMGRFEILFKSNINYICLKAQKGLTLSIEEFLEVGKYLDTVKHLVIYNQSLQSANIDNNILNSYVSNLIYSKNLNLRIKEVINNFGEILDDASPTLKSIRRQIVDAEKSVTVKLNEIISKNATKLTQTIVTMRNDRYVIPVKNDFKNAIKGFIHDTSSSGETVFIEPLAIFEINNKVNSLKEEERKEIARILLELSVMVSEHIDEIDVSYNILMILDMIFSKAELSLELNGVRPKINNVGTVSLLNCYHPLLNVEKIVKNNIIINKDIKGIIITGPNTGGKTVILKTIGLLSLMVKFGLLIPCAEGSEINIFDDVYSDIGDEQSISQNLSTFSSHLKNVISIMDSVSTKDDLSSKSLVLLDELGSGTDPAEGASLAIAIFDYLISKNALVITSSHYGELKLHAFESDNILNASVEFDINTLKPTYKLLIGVPGESNALKISRILGLNPEVVDYAEKLSNENTNEISNVLEKLTKTSHELEKKLNETRNKEYLVNKKLDEIDTLKDKINKERNEIIKKANLDAEEIIKKKEKEIKELIDDLKDLKSKSVKGHEISDLVHKFNEMKTKEEPTNTKVFNINKEIEVNDNVFIEKYNAYGVVIKINKNKYEVQIGNATITCVKDDLELTNKSIKPQITPKKDIIISAPRKSVSARLDLRGMRFEDAEPLIDDYIQDAHYAGLQSVSIIHGFGTGVIRELVQKKLRGHRLVKSFRYGGQNEGGMGATIVEFK